MDADTFIRGYLCGKGSSEDSDIMSGFERYIEKKFKVTTTHGWARTINHNSSDPHAALESFFELFKEYVHHEIG